MYLYLTADEIGTPTGGGAVTYHESLALQSMGEETTILSRKDIDFNPADPFDQDFKFRERIADLYAQGKSFKLAHCYAGCLTETVKYLKSMGCKVAYTAAAHSIEESRKEHYELGIDYDRLFPHMIQPDLWNRYKEGYLLADALVVPSSYSQKVMEGYGAKNPITIIPHGCYPPEKQYPLPKMFAVGYIGATGPDKGLKYLLQAWKKLNYKDAMLTLGGLNMVNPYVMDLIRQYGGGCIRLMGWMKNVMDFYKDISVLVQPSVSEGFGITVLEAMASNRAVICSDGAGASDLVFSDGLWFPARDIDELCTCIEHYRRFPMEAKYDGDWNRSIAEEHTWGKIMDRYVSFWKGML